MLFLHGNPDSSLLWEPVAALLSRQFRCIAPDLPGYGRSTAPPDFDYTLTGQARFLQALARELGFTHPIAVVGHDFGAIFAMAWMARHPEMIRAAVISNSAFFPDYKWHLWAKAWRRHGLGEVMMALMSLRGMRFVYRAGVPRIPARYIEDAYRLLTPGVRQNILRLYRSVPAGAFASWEADYLRAAKHVPVLVLWADGDPFIPKRFAERFAAQRIVRFERSGHWLPLAEPAAFANETAGFLRAT
ncbi:MAG: alpha/beta fold hydrolase [Burkholderiales bacterium]|nr:alpha/beta fold hydrolase [Burkholderiales bacterium]